MKASIVGIRSAIKAAPFLLNTCPNTALKEGNEMNLLRAV